MLGRICAVILCDSTIHDLIGSGHIKIDPFDPTLVQPASLDVRLGTEFKVLRPANITHLDPAEQTGHLWEPVEATHFQPFVLHPGQFALGHTLERVGLPADVAAQLGGKSSLARLGLAVHATAGWIDPGFSDPPATIVLEFSNVGPVPMVLRPGMRISQLIFMRLDEAAERPYGHPDLNSKYQGQQGAQPGMYHLNERPSS